MEKDVIISIKDVTMVFNLASERVDSLKEFLLKTIQRKLFFQPFCALDNINMEITTGDSVALIGVNGSGKSTLLKIVAGVLEPTRGSLKVRGTVAPLIELGAGFDPELTARENIYLNGAVLGYDRKFMNEHFNSIVEFAELQQFIDVPVKNFSSGMVARLGFSIATEVKADILIVDEVLSVGDYKFQEKCKARIAHLMDGGTTLLFVSHSTEQVRSLCKKAAWIDHGNLKAYGFSDEICNAYEAE